ncbi:MAG: GDSL-type esterase/lipase family protein [Planctomycetaceae bacterium]
MNPLVFHIVSGDAFFSGVAMLLAVVCYRWYCRNEATGSAKVRLLLLILSLSGLIGVIFSSTPMPMWLAIMLAGITLTWTGMQWYGSTRRFKTQRVVVVMMVFGWSLAAIREFPWRLLPVTATAPVTAMSIIGDSVSAGMEEGEAETWPSLLSRQHDIEIQDLSHVGETAGSALRRAIKVGILHDYVVVEIGGNDILGSTSPAQFEVDLDALLSALRREKRQVVMFELPLPPFYHSYGMCQRRLAKKYEVALIPKRYFLSILAAGDATLDSIHLSQSGHQTMSNLVWRLSRPE